MPTAPTINFINLTGAGTLSDQYINVNYNNVGTGDHNQLWRMAVDEYSGQYIQIADNLPWATGLGEGFRDFSASNNKIYYYYMVAIDGSGNTAASASKAAPLTAYKRSVLFTVAINEQITGSTIGNGTNIIEILDLDPQLRAYDLSSLTRIGSNASLPSLGIGTIERVQINPTSISIYGSRDYRSSIRSIYLAAGYACYRDLLGNKYFGRLRPPQERYGSMSADLGLTLDIISYSEDISGALFPGANQASGGGTGPFVEEDVVLLSSIVVDSSVGTKQALYTVPVGNSALPHYVIVRSPTVSLAGIGDVLSFGFDAGASDYQNDISSTQLALLTSSTKATGTTFLSPDSSGAIPIIGAAGDVFGCKFHDTGITSNVTIEVWGALF